MTEPLTPEEFKAFLNSQQGRPMNEAFSAIYREFYKLFEAIRRDNG